MEEGFISFTGEFFVVYSIPQPLYTISIIDSSITKRDNMRLILRILDLLSTKEKLTINEISTQLDETYSFVNRVINRLIKENILKKEVIGNSYLCSLNLNNEKTLSYLTLNEIEKKEKFIEKLKNIKTLLNQIKERISADCIIIFGSYAKGTQTKSSDIDLLIINNKKDNSINKEINQLETMYDIKINQIIVNQNIFKEMIQNNVKINVGKEALKNHIILNGSNVFWKIVCEARC